MKKRRNFVAEFVVAVTGVVEKRSGAVNENLKTGAIEVRAKDIRILSESETPPFPIEENSKTKDELRLKYRYPGSASSGSSEKSDHAKQSGDTDQTVFGRRRILGDRDTDAYKEYTGRRKRLSGT